MAKSRKLNIRFPLGGLDRRGAYQKQPPYTTPDSMNVRPYATIKGRERGGSRPGLDLAMNNRPTAQPIRLLNSMNVSQYDGFRWVPDFFNGTSLAEIWTTASWASASPDVLSSFQAAVDFDLNSAACVRDAVPIDSSQEYTVEVYIAPYKSEHHGKYTIYARLDDSTPDITTEGVYAELTMVGSTGAYSGSLTKVVAGVETSYAFTGGTDTGPVAGWFRMYIDGDNVSCYWRDHDLLLTQAVDAMSGLRMGFGMECTEAGGICLVDTFRTQYYQDTELPQIQDLLVSSANGDFYRETFRGTLEEVTSNLSLRSDVPIESVQRGQNLYIADYGLASEGTDGTATGTSFDATGVSDWTTLGANIYDYVVVISNAQGTAVDGTYAISAIASGNLTLATSAGSGACSYRLERAPKVYNPITNSLSLLTATVGQTPSGNPLIARFRDRIVLAGADNAPQVWYMSRQADPTDWDYAEEDSQRAVAGTSSPAGVPGEPITAIAAHSDDYLIIGCSNSLWIMRGDPAYQGELDCLSQTIGIVDQGAWTFGPSGELVFLSRDGIYMVPPGASGFPQAISREFLPAELINVDATSTTVLIEYDARDRGVHIYLTPESPNDRVHWWMDWDRKTFWPVALQSDFEATAITRLSAQAAEDTGVILGGRDGWLRRYSNSNATDGGFDIETYLFIGPVPLGDDYNSGKIQQMIGVLAKDSGDLQWSVLPGDTYEDAVNNSAVGTGLWEEKRNNTVRPGGRGQAFIIKLEGAGGATSSLLNEDGGNLLNENGGLLITSTRSTNWALEGITAVTTLAGKQRVTN